MDEDEDDDDEEAEEGYEDLVDNQQYRLEEGPNARDIEGKRRLEEMWDKWVDLDLDLDLDLANLAKLSGFSLDE